MLRQSITAIVALVALASAAMADGPGWSIEAAQAGDARFASALSNPAPYTAQNYHPRAVLYAPGLEYIYGRQSVADYWNGVRRAGLARLVLEQSTYERLWTDARGYSSFEARRRQSLIDAPTDGVIMSHAVYRMVGANGQNLGWMRVVTRWRDCRASVDDWDEYMCIENQVLQEINVNHEPRDLERG
ncbi:MAG: hypothetical protein ACI82N_000774 [Maricaulis sp.]|jgi:hypothetical protein